MKTLFSDMPWLFAAVPAALLAVLAVLGGARQRRRRREALVSPDLGRRAGLMPAPGRGAPVLVLSILAVLGIALALARPRWGRTEETLTRKGTDVVILLDTSASMRATDVSPSRFVLAQKAALSLLSRLGADRVALVATEGEAQVLSPLTLDTAAVALFLDALEPGIGAKPGTSLAAGLAAATELFPAGTGAGKHCVVISDGEDLEGGVEAAIAKAKTEGIVVHAVFVGSSSGRGAPVPEVDPAGRVTGYKVDGQGAPILSKADPELLRKLAAETKGGFSTVAPGKTDLEGLAEVIDLTARRGDEETIATNLEERYQIPLGAGAAAIALLLLGAGAGSRRRALAGGTAGAAALFGLASLVTAGPARAQSPALPATAAAPALPATAPSATSVAPEPVPAPAPAGFTDRLLARPPFTTARGEAIKGKKALESKQNPEAVARFTKEAELAPKDPTGLYNLGTALSAAGKGPEALASLEKARRGGVRDVAADAAFNTGTTLYRTGDYDGAAGAFRESLRQTPGRPDAAYNYELCVRRSQEEQKKKQEQQNKQDQKQQQSQGSPPPPTPAPDPKADQQKKKQQQDKEFEEKAKMSREKADQLLSAIDRADLEEQKRKIAEQKKTRRVARDW